MKRKISLRNLKFILAPLILSGTDSFAQTTITKESPEAPSWLTNPSMLFIGIGLLILVIAIIALANTVVRLSKAVAEVKKKSAATILLLLISAAAFSQTEAAVSETKTELPAWASNPDVYLLGFLFFIIILTIAVLYNVNMRLIKTIAPDAFETKPVAETIAAAVAERKPTFLRRIYLRMVDSVPVAHEKDILLDHDYDGIKELDNNLPPWWKYGFYATIVFAVFYMIIYHVSGAGKLPHEEYKDELLLAEKQKEERMKASAENVNEENVVAFTDAEAIGKGKETFQKLCVACHLATGGGQVGPNLTDEYWLHGGGIKNIFKTITYGVPDKGMLSWKSQLTPKQIQQVASYVLSLKGMNPPGGKEPQGDKWIDENAVKNDSISKVKTKTDAATVASADTLKK